MESALSVQDLTEHGLSEKPLSEEQADAFRAFFMTWKTASVNLPDGTESEAAAIKRAGAVFKLLFGEKGEWMLSPKDDRHEAVEPDEQYAELDGTEEAVEGAMTMSLAQAKPKHLRARLRHALATGRCDRKQFVQMSLMSPQAVRGCLPSVESLPAGTYAADARELSDAKDRRDFERLFPRGKWV